MIILEKGFKCMLGGFVTKSNIYINGKKQLEFDDEGLFSQKIFGPTKDYKCKCGKLNIKTLDAGKLCPTCGVVCDSSELRTTTFGQIKIVFPVIKPTKQASILKIVGKEHKKLLIPEWTDDHIATERYLSIRDDCEQLKIISQCVNHKDYHVIPFRITGLYSLILALKYVAVKLNLDIAKSIFEDNVIMDILKVLPPNVRPVHSEMKGHKLEQKIMPINKEYQNLLNLNKHHAILAVNFPDDEEQWMDRIHYSFKNQILDQDIVDATIIEYDQIASRYQYYVNTVYDTVNGMISGKTGLIRESILGRTIEFSARSVITSDPSLKPYQARVSKKILFKLWHPYFLHYLTSVRGYEFDDCFKKYVNRTFDETKEEFNEFLEWFCNKKDS